MSNFSGRKSSVVGIYLLRELAEAGFKTFSIKDAKKYAQKLKISVNYIPEALVHLQKNNWVTRIKRGLYAFTPAFGMQMLHEFVVAQSLVPSSIISHWTAMHYHHLTQQTPNVIFSTLPASTSVPRKIDKNKYRFVYARKELFYGIQKIWLDEVQVAITYLERTLIDGLRQPKFCGDFYEVMQAFKMAKDRMNIEKLIDYALKCDSATAKRLGWVLENLGVSMKRLKALYLLPIKGYRKLDPSGLQKGKLNKKWMIQENI